MWREFVALWNGWSFKIIFIIINNVWEAMLHLLYSKEEEKDYHCEMKVKQSCFERTPYKNEEWYHMCVDGSTALNWKKTSLLEILPINYPRLSYISNWLYNFRVLFNLVSIVNIYIHIIFQHVAIKIWKIKNNS